MSAPVQAASRYAVADLADSKSTPPFSGPAHQTLALWAIACAEHVLLHFEAERPHDERPRQALAACLAWVRGELPMTQVREFAFRAHAAARDAQGASARAAARAAGQAAGTAHVLGHARHAAAYAVKAQAAAAPKTATTEAAAREQEWQRLQLAAELWPLAFEESKLDLPR